MTQTLVNNAHEIDDPTAYTPTMLSDWQSGIWTAIPGIVQSFNASELTVEVQPAIQAKYLAEDGSVKIVNLPKLVDCPVVFPHGGGCSLTFPVKSGEYSISSPFAPS